MSDIYLGDCREYIGIEQNPEYFSIIKARLGLK